MNKLIEVMKDPSGMDSLSNYMGDIPESNLLVLMTRNRDSDLLTESNWETAIKKLGGESETVEIHRFGHWACGWWESLCVVQGSKSETVANEIFESLQDYPVLDEEDFSEREENAAQEIWEDCYTDHERIDYIRRNRSQFDFYGWSELMKVARGKYFNGYAIELIG